MPMAPGMVNPLFECELAESLHMTLAELRYGRGTPMSAHELCVEWPAYFARKQIIAQREADKQAKEQGRA